MTDTYNDALRQQARENIWTTLRQEAANMSAMDRAGLIADVAGIFDPTPISDGVGGVLSLARGDWLGAGLSVLGMIPYIGDTGKIAKIARRAPRAAELLRAVFIRGDNLARASEAFLRNNFTLRQIQAARATAARRVQEALLRARNGLPCRDCTRLPGQGRGRLQMPSGTGAGRWTRAPDANGNGIYTFNAPARLPNGRTVTSIEYRNGFPNFDRFTADGKHTLWQVSGNARTDGAALTRQIRASNPAYNPPSATDFVLHHFEDGRVGYIPRSVHDRALGGAAHSGGNTIVNNQLF
jgi:hypothetical protein